MAIINWIGSFSILVLMSIWASILFFIPIVHPSHKNAYAHLCCLHLPVGGDNSFRNLPYILVHGVASCFVYNLCLLLHLSPTAVAMLLNLLVEVFRMLLQYRFQLKYTFDVVYQEFKCCFYVW